uniref:(northern house mosquito) hypothetical protein n=1 Tax=Culex pipiens TaxID=7175 RepID=A0A8D8DMZ7_CULPI
MRLPAKSSRPPTCKQNTLFCRVPRFCPCHTQPNLTHETNRVARTIATAVASSSSSRRRRCVVVVRPKCATNYPKSNSISTDHQKHTRTHNPPPPPSILPTNQSTKSMSSDFDDDIDFDPDDLTILLHFFRKL